MCGSERVHTCLCNIHVVHTTPQHHVQYKTTPHTASNSRLFQLAAAALVYDITPPTSQTLAPLLRTHAASCLCFDEMQVGDPFSALALKGTCVWGGGTGECVCVCARCTDNLHPQTKLQDKLYNTMTAAAQCSTHTPASHTYPTTYTTHRYTRVVVFQWWCPRQHQQ